MKNQLYVVKTQNDYYAPSWADYAYSRYIEDAELFTLSEASSFLVHKGARCVEILGDVPEHYRYELVPVTVTTKTTTTITEDTN